MEEKHLKITAIAGEYATLTDVKDGEELFIALALLPPGADLGTCIVYRDYTFEIEE